MYVLLNILWIILNGRFTLEIFIFGLIISLFIYLFMIKYMNFSTKREKAFFRFFPLSLKYLFVLIFEIFKANFQVIKKIIFLDKNEPSSLVKFELDFKSDFAQVVLADSITITPGTITIKVKDDMYVVHGLSKEFTEGIESSSFVKMLKEIEDKINE